jgi:iron complex outermembrane receptor protein
MLFCVATVAAPAAPTPACSGMGEEAPDPPQENAGGGPAASASGERHEEWISVTAETRESAAAPLGASSTVITPNLAGGTPSTIKDVVVETAGVSENGQGGLFQVFSIRGLSRHRVQTLVSGVRIYSERRAGPSAHFIDPLLLGTAEVLRGPSTTLHGSGAMGGVVQVFPRLQRDWSLLTGYDTRGDQNYQVLGYGEQDWSLAVARRNAGNARGADGSELNGGFTQYSAALHGGWGKGPRRYEILFVPARGEDIGKASDDFPGRVTSYPLERHNLLEFSIDARSGWRAQFFLHPWELETEVTEPGESRNRVRNESFDYGARWERGNATGPHARILWGFQLSARERVRATETNESLDPANPQPLEELQTLNDAREIEGGAYATFRREKGRIGLEVGARLSGLHQRNAGMAPEESGGVSGFLGVTRRLGQRLKLRGALSSGLRFPNLSERFFTGTTGAGGIVGNPDLEQERSVSVEVSADWTGQRIFLSGTLFQNEIDDYVERVVLSGDLLTYRNLTSGRVRGFELQGLFLLGESWRVNYGGQVMRGRASDDTPLADVPPDEVYLGVLHRHGSWSFGSRLAYRAAKSDPGPAELARRSALVLRFTADHRLSELWTISLTADNLLDETYFPTADRRATVAPGRSAGLMFGLRR